MCLKTSKLFWLALNIHTYIFFFRAFFVDLGLDRLYVYWYGRTYVDTDYVARTPSDLHKLLILCTIDFCIKSVIGLLSAPTTRNDRQRCVYGNQDWWLNAVAEAQRGPFLFFNVSTYSITTNPRALNIIFSFIYHKTSSVEYRFSYITAKSTG